ncbi:DegT/DnrJ/EryC1/StrS aminotransferase [Malaciobacter molluscorum LMG 25693]|uniref:Aminotransferase, DegT/DnrJ/EryC1/StrS family n=1 Tax=Malaciobacter molluscorum LMG 25693 TaxID=870501 RepID=A0A2G1DFM5_9BACT|nr:DegT/DnrJ/EryC1/StrS family aminotransferase [Malaciobacter molluscorum]AXX93547.1 aminotransferase, DegT/DnrJ/EryC1/StrS family [Malaciobacter molluscorum LMG 25693]PHO17298.1 DegT/DnrJ/EryC1/StrS aminotransferase [Malaciobacter molluscorum LMG 25693]
MPNLAINGGNKVRKELFGRYNNIDQKEIDEVVKVMKKGVLSKYLGAWHEDFYGGEKVQEFEQAWSEYFDVKHSISVNSNSSGLITALGACGIGLGDEVIVSPYSMSISATAPLFWNATPVFCDLEPNSYSFCIDSLKKAITKNTKVIVVVHIFGCPSNMKEIMQVAKENNLYVIEDCAQAPGAKYDDKFVGTIGDIGVFSLNYHKHIHTGEGGVCTTNNDALANKMQLIRNHAESVVENKGETEFENMLGFNFRLTEIQAAIGIEQLKKLNSELKIRQQYAKMYDEALSKYPFIKITRLENRTHSYYVQAFQFIEDIAKVSRDKFINAVKAELEVVEGRENEGVPIGQGYVKPIYMLPMFQNKIAYNKRNFAFKEEINYEKGTCPNVEKFHFHTLWTHDLTRSPFTKEDVNDIINAYVKVCENLDELR